MKRPHFLIKLAVIANAVLLVGGCIGYGTGSFDWIQGRNPSTAKPAVSQQAPADNAQPMHTITPGTNPFTPIDMFSGMTPATNPSSDLNFPTELPKADEKQLIFMVGPKSDAGLTGSIILNEINRQTAPPPALSQSSPPSK